MKNQSVRSNIDWIIVSIYITLVILGWLNIYSSSLPEIETTFYDTTQFYGKQLFVILFTIPLIFAGTNSLITICPEEVFRVKKNNKKNKAVKAFFMCGSLTKVVNSVTFRR